MKAIMISIKPKWVAKILNGEKTIEIRKTKPKCDLPIDVYIYCTKDGGNGLYWNGYKWVVISPQIKGLKSINNGKVVAKFTLNKITPTYHFYEEEICSLSGLSDDELFNYLGYADGYAWHIDNLVIFDKPKELRQYHLVNDKLGVKLMGLTKAPQSWCYVEGDKIL